VGVGEVVAVRGFEEEVPGGGADVSDRRVGVGRSKTVNGLVTVGGGGVPVRIRISYPVRRVRLER
jgi:hypothetical protein